jgi:hypothetical protein
MRPVTGGWSNRIARARLASPLALLTAGATAFLIYAMPNAVAEPALAGLGIDPLTAVTIPFAAGPRVATGLLLALLSGGAVWMLLDRLGPARPRRDRSGAQAAADRRAETSPLDSRPVAERRRPLFAASDLGTPMDDVARGSTPFGRPPLFRDEDAEAVVERAPPTPQPGAGDASISHIMRRLELEIARGDECVTRSRPGADHDLSTALTTLRRAVSER